MKFSKRIPKRLFKCLIFFILIVTFLWKTYEAWHKFNMKDKMIVTEVEYPKYQTFPSVTICRNAMAPICEGKNVSNIFEFNSELDNWLQSEFENEDATQNWEARKLSRYISRETNCTTCFTFTPPNEIAPGMRHTLDLYIKSNVSDIMYILLHDPVNNIPIYGDIFGTNALALPVLTYRNTVLSMHLSIGTEEVIRLGTEKQPCHDVRANMTLCDCMDKYFQKVEGCILPWQQNNTRDFADKTCDKNNLRHYQKYMDRLIGDGSYGEMFHSTGCIPNCKQAIYSMKKSMEVTLPWANPNYSMSVGFFLAPTGVTLKREVLVFDGLELVGNVGGYLGLLLGWSALSLVKWYFKHNCQ